MVKQERVLSSKLATNPDHSNSVKYTGVRKRKWGKYVSEIRLPNSRERIWLGSYDTPEKAARAFDAALFCLRGNTANFNFPDHPPQIPGGRSLLPAQIQAAAARYANHYHSDISSADISSTCNSSDHEESPSPSVLSYQLTTNLLGETWTSPSYMNIFDDTDISSINTDTNTNLGVLDFEIFPGFDDYFMTPTLPATDDYGEENCDGNYLQDPSFLWNF